MASTSRLPLFLLTVIVLLVLLPSPAAAFGAGNIASIAKIEGRNWRHGDIEDTLKKIAFIKGHKWTSMMIKRVYFGNWLRDYSQALDVGTVKTVQAGTIRILVWVLSFLSFGYATGEFEVTEERLGVYRPEEHIDNPKDYADNQDARKYDPRLRPPVHPIELAVDPQTGMKNYIANEQGGWATSTGYVKHSLSRCIHFGRVYTSGAQGSAGKEADLCEALRCLGQALHCMEDFGAHSNYVELALRELGFTGVFPHVGTATEINLHGKRVFPLVTGSFGVVDFLHSVIGEATDHFAQTELDEANLALGEAEQETKKKKKTSGGGTARSGQNPAQEAQFFTSLLSQLPGASGLCQQAEKLQADADAREFQNLSISEGSRGVDGYYGSTRASAPQSFDAPPGSVGGPPGPGVPGMSPNFDPIKTAAQIYPILEFRDNVVRVISATIEKIPGLEALVEKITETLTIFIFSLLAPIVRPIINAVSGSLKQGSSQLVDASGKSQYEPWNNPHCTDPTHSLLSKDHFSNKLNDPAGQVAAAIVMYVVPRVLYAWEHPQIPDFQILQDVTRAFHHPAIRDPNNELHQNMFNIVDRWVKSLPDRGANLNYVLGSEGVKTGKNHSGGLEHGLGQLHSHAHGGGTSGGKIHGAGSHSKVSGSEWEKIQKKKKKDQGQKREGGYAGADHGGSYGAAGVPGGYSGDHHYSQGGGYDQHHDYEKKKSKEHKEGKEYKEKKDKDSKKKDKKYSDDEHGGGKSRKKKDKYDDDYEEDKYKKENKKHKDPNKEHKKEQKYSSRDRDLGDQSGSHGSYNEPSSSYYEDVPNEPVPYSKITPDPDPICPYNPNESFGYHSANPGSPLQEYRDPGIYQDASYTPAGGHPQATAGYDSYAAYPPQQGQGYGQPQAFQGQGYQQPPPGGYPAYGSEPYPPAGGAGGYPGAQGYGGQQHLPGPEGYGYGVPPGGRQGYGQGGYQQY